MTPQEFVATWSQVDQTERATAQSHFIALCHMLGVKDPIEEDPTGENYGFEHGVDKTAGGNGWADVWRRGCFGWEYKKPGGNLERAYVQLLQYKDALDNPPLLIVSDIKTIVIHTNFTNTPKVTKTIRLERLEDPKIQDLLRYAWTNPKRFRPEKTTEAVTEEAARKFSELAAHLRERGVEPDRAAHFLIRLLFCLFAEDTGLLPERLFERLVKNGVSKPDAFNKQLRVLFGAMADGGFFGEHEIKHINGKLFDSDDVVALERTAISMLGSVTYLDWSAIEPAILGTLFERSLDPSKRAQLGAHYTSKDDILLIVEPVLMAPLERRWEQVKAEAEALAKKRDGAGRRAERTKAENQLRRLLLDFAGELASVRVLDPACGSGNFLYVALKELLDLWKRVSTFSKDIGIGLLLPTDDISPSPAQLHGIEVNEYAHELAQVTVWIGYLQWLRDNGFGSPGEPILKPIETIENRDAILDHDEMGRPVEPDWPEVNVIVGNPPFLGDKKMRSELGDSYTEELRSIYSERLPSQSDLVCYWVRKSLQQLNAKSADRCGLLATQAIRGGANRVALEQIVEAGRIFWAHSDREWVLDGATVHVSMIGFDLGSGGKSELDGDAVEHINANLTSKADVTQAARLDENSALCFIGTQRTGPFDIDHDTAMQILRDTGNPNGCPNSDVVRRWVNASDIMRFDRKRWIIDFGVGTSLKDASEFSAPFEYVRQTVLPVRKNNRQKVLRERWWLFEKPRPAMRTAFEEARLSRYVATPMVSKHRVFVWLPREVLAENLLVVFARDDDYFMGVVHSRAHETWARASGTQLREAASGTRYTPTSTFATFPFPWPPGDEPPGDPRVEAIADSARELIEKRDLWLNPEGMTEKELKKRTLTNLYNARPIWLDLAHQRLDEAVLDAYDWPHDVSDDSLLKRLLALNIERAE